MAKRKVIFDLEMNNEALLGSTISIIGSAPKYAPYVSIEIPHLKAAMFIKDADLKRFARNILEALDPKSIKQ